MGWCLYLDPKSHSSAVINGERQGSITTIRKASKTDSCLAPPLLLPCHQREDTPLFPGRGAWASIKTKHKTCPGASSNTRQTSEKTTEYKDCLCLFAQPNPPLFSAIFSLLALFRSSTIKPNGKGSVERQVCTIPAASLAEFPYLDLWEWRWPAVSVCL